MAGLPDHATLVQLRLLRAALLRDAPPTLGPDQGGEAFHQHKLLTTIVHRVTGLNKGHAEREGRAWVRYFAEHFPSPRNGAVDADLLWKDWRTDLLKTDSPGLGVTITHGQPHAHWQRDASGRLCIDLESMWSDYASSVDSFIRHLEATPERCQVALQRWQEKGTLVVETVKFSTMYAAVSGATAMASATAGPSST